MATGIVFSSLAAMLSVLAFCLARWPMGWIKLWSPWRTYLAKPYLAHGEQRLLVSIRVRAGLAGIALLAIAIILPVTGSALFRLPKPAQARTNAIESAPPTLSANMQYFFNREVPTYPLQANQYSLPASD